MIFAYMFVGLVKLTLRTFAMIVILCYAAIFVPCYIIVRLTQSQHYQRRVQNGHHYR